MRPPSDAVKSAVRHCVPVVGVSYINACRERCQLIPDGTFGLLKCVRADPHPGGMAHFGSPSEMAPLRI